ncbi:hypothetical protein D3C80_2146660 [compost metagenome]
MHTRYRQACKAREHRPNRSGHQQDHRFAEHFLALRRFHQGTLQLLGHARFQEDALLGALTGLL